MHADERDGSKGNGTAIAGALPLDPLERLAAEHPLQLELCNALELIADGLPNRFDQKLVHEATNVLAHGMARHFLFEEEVFFPMLRRRAASDASLVAALDQLEIEHGRDAGLSSELAEELRYFLMKEHPRNPEMLGYMLRGYFEGQRRHIEWENSVVLPAARRFLTRPDLDELARLIEHGASKPAAGRSAGM